MAVPGGPLHTSAAQADPLDDEWERFQANGCPDWWLLTKYVSQAASRIPYQPFRSATTPSWVGSPPSGAHGASSSAPTGQQEAHGVELLLQQQQQQQQQQPCSKDVAAAAAGDHNKAPAGRPPSPDAVPTSPCKPSAAAPTAAAPPACGLKGIFGCTGGCTPPCTAAKSADQTA